MKKKIDSNFALPMLICFIPFILSAMFYKQLPEQVAIHFDSAGNPDNFAPKMFAAFGIPLLMLCIFLFSRFMISNSPKRENAPVQIKHLSKWLVPIISVFMQAGIITYSIDGSSFNWKLCNSLFLSLLFIIIGNYLPKCRHNYIIGYKLPWTLHDIDNWNKTHRLAGYLWIVSGIIVIVNIFLQYDYVLPFIVLILVVVPLAYSYLQYKNKPFDSDSQNNPNGIS